MIELGDKFQFLLVRLSKSIDRGRDHLNVRNKRVSIPSGATKQIDPLDYGCKSKRNRSWSFQFLPVRLSKSIGNVTVLTDAINKTFQFLPVRLSKSIFGVTLVNEVCDSFSFQFLPVRLKQIDRGANQVLCVTENVFQFLPVRLSKSIAAKGSARSGDAVVSIPSGATKQIIP